MIVFLQWNGRQTHGQWAHVPAVVADTYRLHFCRSYFRFNFCLSSQIMYHISSLLATSVLHRHEAYEKKNVVVFIFHFLSLFSFLIICVRCARQPFVINADADAVYFFNEMYLTAIVCVCVCVHGGRVHIVCVHSAHVSCSCIICINAWTRWAVYILHVRSHKLWNQIKEEKSEMRNNDAAFISLLLLLVFLFVWQHLILLTSFPGNAT